MSAPTDGRRFYRLRAPRTPTPTPPSPSASTPTGPTRTRSISLSVPAGAGCHLTPDEAWALWRCLSEAVASLGTHPSYIRTDIRPARR